jgi:crotonobetainyl-CoA:carnitine CoA-transferase CaiB-like acyl-CoA transferase
MNDSAARPRRGPLDGVRVLAGVFCSLILAGLGAEVIKNEPFIDFCCG